MGLCPKPCQEPFLRKRFLELQKTFNYDEEIPPQGSRVSGRHIKKSSRKFTFYCFS